MVEVLRHKKECSGFDSWYGPWVFLSDLLLLCIFSNPGVQTAAKKKKNKFLLGKVRPVRGANNSAVLVVLNVKVRLEAENSMLPLSFHHLLCETFFKYVNEMKIMTYKKIT